MKLFTIVNEITKKDQNNNQSLFIKSKYRSNEGI